MTIARLPGITTLNSFQPIPFTSGLWFPTLHDCQTLSLHLRGRLVAAYWPGISSGSLLELEK